MTDLITQAEQRLLRPGGLSQGDLDGIFARLMGPSIDAADLYFQHSRSEAWVLEDGIVKEGNHSIEQGVGVRALSGEKAGFAYSDEIVLPALLEAAGSARAIAQAGSAGDLLYRHCGWTEVGTIPDHSLTPDGRLPSAQACPRRRSRRRSARGTA